MGNTLYIAKMVKRNGKLEYVNPNDRNLFIKNVEGLREGQTIEQMVDFTADSGKLGELARVHQIIGMISKETGDSSGAVKLEVKKRAGLYKFDKTCKSFADCSSDELKFAIQVAIELGEFCGLNCR